MSNKMSQNERIADPNVIIDREMPNTRPVATISQTTPGGVPHSDSVVDGGAVDDDEEEPVVGGYSNAQQKDSLDNPTSVEEADRHPGELASSFEVRQATVGNGVGCDVRETPAERDRAQSWAADERAEAGPTRLRVAQRSVPQPTDDEQWGGDGTPYADVHKRDSGWEGEPSVDGTELGAQADVDSAVVQHMTDPVEDETGSGKSDFGWPNELVGQREESSRATCRYEAAAERVAGRKAANGGLKPIHHSAVGRLDSDEIGAVNTAAKTLRDQWDPAWTPRWFQVESPTRSLRADERLDASDVPSQAWIAHRLAQHVIDLGQEPFEAGMDIQDRGVAFANGSDVVEPRDAVFTRDATQRLTDRATALCDRWELPWSQGVIAKAVIPSTVTLATLIARRVGDAGDVDDGVFANAGFEMIEDLEDWEFNHTIGGYEWWKTAPDKDYGVTLDVTVTKVFEPFGTRAHQVAIVEDKWGREAKLTVWKGFQEAKPLSENGIDPSRYELADSPATCDTVGEGDRVHLFNFRLGWYNGQPQLRSARDVEYAAEKRFNAVHDITENESELHVVERGDGELVYNDHETNYDGAEPGKPWELSFGL